METEMERIRRAVTTTNVSALQKHSRADFRRGAVPGCRSHFLRADDSTMKTARLSVMNSPIRKRADDGGETRPQNGRRHQGDCARTRLVGKRPTSRWWLGLTEGVIREAVEKLATEEGIGGQSARHQMDRALHATEEIGAILGEARVPGENNQAASSVLSRTETGFAAHGTSASTQRRPFMHTTLSKQ